MKEFMGCFVVAAIAMLALYKFELARNAPPQPCAFAWPAVFEKGVYTMGVVIGPAARALGPKDGLVAVWHCDGGWVALVRHKGAP